MEKEVKYEIDGSITTLYSYKKAKRTHKNCTNPSFLNYF